MKIIVKRILSFVFIFSLIFFVVFLGFNKAKETKAVVFPAVSLGVGALSALVGAYFATSGIQLSGSGDNADSFLGSYIARWVRSQGSFTNNPYFSIDGEFIGSSDDLTIVQNNDSDVVSFIFGKEFAIWLESLKQLFVSDKSLTSDSKVISSTTYITLPSGASYTYVDNTYSILPMFSVVPLNGGDVSISLNSNTVLRIYDTIVENVSSNQYRSTFSYTISRNGSVISSNTLTQTGSRSLFSVNMFYAFYKNASNNLSFGLFRGGTVSGIGSAFTSHNSLSIDLSSYVSLSSTSTSNISLEGSLTDGYSDFEDAINQDLDSDNEDLVVGVGVGEFTDILNPVDILDGILDKIIGGTLNPTYEGPFENQEDAVEELEGNRPFIPVLPNGWVQVEGLQSFFPFCIPFDLYNVIALLNVSPEAPQFTWRMGFGSQFEPYDVEIDLQPYESVARVFRIMVVVGFLLFLILKTRDLIRG